MHYLHFEKGYFQNLFRYFRPEMRVMFFQNHVLQKLQKVKNVKVRRLVGLLRPLFSAPRLRFSDIIVIFATTQACRRQRPRLPFTRT